MLAHLPRCSLVTDVYVKQLLHSLSLNGQGKLMKFSRWCTHCPLSQSIWQDSLSLQPHNQPKAGPAASPCVCSADDWASGICLLSCCRGQTGWWDCLQMFHREKDYFPDWWINRVVNTVSLVRGDPWSIMWQDRCFIWEGVQDPKKRYVLDWYGGPSYSVSGMEVGRLDSQWPQTLLQSQSLAWTTSQIWIREWTVCLNHCLLFQLFFQQTKGPYHQECSHLLSTYLLWITKRAAEMTL